MVQHTEQQRILRILNELPPEKLDEIIDFAEYLREKLPQKIKKKAHPVEIPTFHLGHIKKGAFDRTALYGEYLDRKIA